VKNLRICLDFSDTVSLHVDVLSNQTLNFQIIQFFFLYFVNFSVLVQFGMFDKLAKQLLNLSFKMKKNNRLLKEKLNFYTG
jgi:hypothetical protein